MIFIRKKTIVKIGIILLIPLLIFLSIEGLLSTEEFLYHQHFKESKMSYNPNTIVKAFTIPTEGVVLFIDLDTHIMTVYKDGKVLKTYPVSGGKTSTPSPIGTWKIVGKADWGEGFGGSWLAFNVPWGKYGIHGTVVPWTIGNCNASKGCIRMKNKDVNELKNFVKYGTVVHIKYDSIPFRAMKNGSFGSDVLISQQKLHTLGFYTGYCDGRFGSGLETAVKKFQKANEMPTDGVIGYQTFEKLKELTEPD